MKRLTLLAMQQARFLEVKSKAERDILASMADLTIEVLEFLALNGAFIYPDSRAKIQGEILKRRHEDDDHAGWHPVNGCPLCKQD